MRFTVVFVVHLRVVGILTVLLSLPLIVCSSGRLISFSLWSQRVVSDGPSMPADFASQQSRRLPFTQLRFGQGS